MRFRTIGTALAVAALAGLTAAAASADPGRVGPAPAYRASAAQIIQWDDWSGYYAESGGKLIDSVNATLTVPRGISCGASVSSGPFEAVQWAGIGGMSDVDGTGVGLEQAGVYEYCPTRDTKSPEYGIWWEMVPASTSPAHAKDHIHPFTVNDVPWPGGNGQPGTGKPVLVNPGDKLVIQVDRSDYGVPPSPGDPGEYRMAVTVNGKYYDTLQVLRADTQPGTTAEVINEWPSGGVGMVDPGTVRFTGTGFLTGATTTPLTGPWPDNAPVTQHKITMIHWPVVDFPGKATNGNFNTYFVTWRAYFA